MVQPQPEIEKAPMDIDLDEKEPATPEEQAEHHVGPKSPEQRKAELEAALAVDPGVGKWSWPAWQVRARRSPTRRTNR